MNFKTFNLFRFDFGFVMVKVKLKGGDLKKCSPFTTSLSFVSIFLSLSLSPISYSLILSQSLSFSFVVWTCVLVCVCCLLSCSQSLFSHGNLPLEQWQCQCSHPASSQCKLIQTSNGSFRTSFRNENNSRERREREKKIGQLLFTIDLQFLSSRSQWPFVSGHPIGSLTNRNCVGDWNERFDWLRSSAALKCNGRKQDG